MELRRAAGARSPTSSATPSRRPAPLIEAAGHELDRLAAARARVPRRRPHPARPGRLEPAHQQRQVHRAGRPDLARPPSGAAARSSSPSATPGSASPRTTCPASSTCSPRSTGASSAPPAASGSGSRWSRAWSRCTAGPSRPRATGPARGAPSPSGSRLRRRPASRRPRPRPRTTAGPPAAGRRILVVDDNQDSARSMARVLKLLGNEVRTAHDGVEAVEAAEEFRPEVILMDVGMPRLNGYEATRRIREQPWGRSVDHHRADRLGPGGRPPPVAGGRVRRPPGQAGQPPRPGEAPGRPDGWPERRGLTRKRVTGDRKQHDWRNTRLRRPSARPGSSSSAASPGRTWPRQGRGNPWAASSTTGCVSPAASGSNAVTGRGTSTSAVSSS